MRVTLAAKGGRVVRSLAAKEAAPTPAVVEEPVAVEEIVEEPVDSPAERWDRMLAEIENDEEAVEPVVAGATPSSAFTILRLAAEEVELSRQREIEIQRREAAAQEERSKQDRGVMREILAALSNFATKPSGDTHISLPATELHPHVTIHEPAITVEPADVHPPDVNVTVEPARVEVPAPVVTVEAPAPTPIEVRPEITVEAAKAPDVHVTVEQPPRPAAIRLEVDDDGTRRFVPEEEEEQQDE